MKRNFKGLPVALIIQTLNKILLILYYLNDAYDNGNI